ncbi:MAG: PEP-CTERM sorting domain-containing protein [Planctomycetota bacterium]|jgi:hypothetical protein
MRGTLLTRSLLTSVAWADTVDFRDPNLFGPASNQTSFDVGVLDGYELTLLPAPEGARLWWDAVDGFGVRYSYEDDEIEGVEKLTVHFSAPVYLDTIHVSDLFLEGGRREIGFYQLDGGTKRSFAAVPGAPNGERSIDVGAAVRTIDFSAPGRGHEFSVKALDVAPSPEPGTLGLCGAVLVGAWVARRRRRARSLSG